MEKMHDILVRLAAEAESGEMVFPTHTEMALRVRRALDNPECSLDQLAKLVRAEPLLAARVVAMANSVVYNRSGRVTTDIRSAVASLGLRALSSLAVALIVRQMEGMSKLPAHRALAERLWEHTAHVAAIAYVLARRVTHQDPDTAFFAGIVHEVGGFYLISRAASFPGLLDGHLHGWYRAGEVRVGRPVLKALSVPQPVVDAIEVMWKGYLALPPETLGDTLLLAEQLARVDSPLNALAGQGHDGVDRAEIDLALGDETLSGIMQESAEEVAALTAALQS
jgi:HD-like signal output (HDOD) protein